VAAARERQAHRLRGSGLLTNAELRVAEVRRWCRPDTAAQSLLRAGCGNCSYAQRAPGGAITACSSWRARSPIWPGAMISVPHTWPRRAE